MRQFGLICIDSVIFLIDLGIFYMIATIWQVGGVGGRIDLGIFGELGLLNLIGSFDFYGFELFGWI